MSILSRIRSWFGGAKNVSVAPAITKSRAVEEANQDTKAKELAEAIKVAHEERSQSSNVEQVAIQPENITPNIQPESNLPSVQNEVTISHDNPPVQYDSPAIDAPTSVLLVPQDASNVVQSTPSELMNIQTESVPSHAQPEGITSSIQIEDTPSYDNTPAQFDSPPVTTYEVTNTAQIDNMSTQPQPKQKSKRTRRSTGSRSRPRKKSKSANPEVLPD
ncbi:MAG: hypothetical protein H3Z53_09125 [archaeon]|nr:hypothetical protein [archaeon]MCP8314515.1 hypothetical protein [archaeon]